MNKEKYEYEEVEINGCDPEIRIKIPRNKLSLGQKIYLVDFAYKDGIQELEVRGINDYITQIDPQTGEEFCRPVKAGETPEGYMIELGEDWESHPYEKYLTKEDAYEASLEEHQLYIKNTQAMIDRWALSIDSSYKRMENIEKELNKIRSFK